MTRSPWASQLGTFGIWRQWQRLTPDLAAEIEKLGFGAIWVGSSPDGDLTRIEDYLDATSRITVATSVVNLWKDDAAAVATSYHRLERKHPGRFLLGLGIGHPEHNTGYTKPYRTIVDYLDALDAADVPAHRRVLAALGPKVLQLSGQRAAGAIPYLVTPEHTRRARQLLGTGPLLAPEHKVVLDEDADRARAIGRPAVSTPYLSLSNYVSSLRDLGYGDADLDGGGSDRLVDDLALHGSPAQVAAGLRRHRDAGADHVVVQLLTEPDADPLPGYAALADALLGTSAH